MKTQLEVKPAIYVGTYKKYNEGSLQGEWVQLDQFTDEDEFLEYIKELHDDEDDPEFMFQDHEGIPEKFISESHLDNDFWEYQETINNCYNPEAMQAFVNAGYDASDFDESYNGQFDSDEDFAENMADELGYINKDVSWPYTCIDWEHAAREIMYDYFEINGYYFRQI